MSVHVSDRLSAYLDGELSVVDAGSVRQHLASCDACSAELRALAAVDRAVRELPVAAPEGYFDTFATRVRTRIESSGQAHGGRGLPRWTWALAAALLLAVILPRMPWDEPAPAARPAQAPALSLPADKDGRREADSFAQAQPTAAPAPTLSARRGPGRLDEMQPSSVVDQPKADAAATPGKARSQYAEPPSEAGAFSTATADARVAREQQPQVAASRAPRPAAPAPYTGAAPAKAAEAESEKQSAELGRLDEAAAAPAEGTAPEEPRAKEQLEKKRERTLGVAGAVAPGRGSLDSRVATSLEERRALREDWRKFAHEHPEDSRADEARVRVVTLGVEIARETSTKEDLARLRADAAAYLARADARQKERVKALLAELDR